MALHLFTSDCCLKEMSFVSTTADADGVVIAIVEFRFETIGGQILEQRDVNILLK